MFSNRFVQVILLSNVFLQIGVWIRNFAVLLYVVEVTNENVIAVSLISVAEFAPIFLFSFIGGTFADRWKPKRTMVWCDILSAASIFAVLGTMVFGSWKAIFFAMLISAILSQFSQPSGMKLFKQHVPEPLIQAGMSMYQTIFAIFLILGPILGTFMFQQAGVTISLAVVGVAFLLSAAVLTLLPPDREDRQEARATSLWTDMKDGFRYVFARKTLSTLSVCFFVAGLAIGLIQPLGVFVVTERLGLPKENLQWLLVSSGIAMLAGGAMAMALSKKLLPQQMLFAGLLIDVAGIWLTGWSTELWLTIVGSVISGLIYPLIQVGMSTFILQQTESDFVGRVNGIMTPMFMGAMVLMMSAAGIVKEHTSLYTVYVLSAALMLIGAIVLLPILKAAPHKQTA